MGSDPAKRRIRDSSSNFILNTLKWIGNDSGFKFHPSMDTKINIIRVHPRQKAPSHGMVNIRTNTVICALFYQDLEVTIILIGVEEN